MGIGLMGLWPMNQNGNKDTRNRPSIRMKLSGRPDSWEALAIIERWKKTRESGKHLIAAIRVYAALLRGDTSVLVEYFPQFNFGLPAAPRKALESRTMQITAVALTKDEIDAGIDDVLGDLEF